MKAVPHWAIALLVLVLGASAVQVYVLSQRVTRGQAAAYLDSRITQLEDQLGADPAPPAIGRESRTPGERWQAIVAAALRLRQATLDVPTGPKLDAAHDAWWGLDGSTELTPQQKEAILGQPGVREALALARTPRDDALPVESRAVEVIDLMTLIEYLRLSATGPVRLGTERAAALELQAQVGVDVMHRPEPLFWLAGAGSVPNSTSRRAQVAGPPLDRNERDRARKALEEMKRSLPSQRRVLLIRILHLYRSVRQDLADDVEFDRSTWDDVIAALDTLDPWHDSVLAAVRIPDADERRARLAELDRQVESFSDDARALAFDPLGELENLRSTRQVIEDALVALAPK